MTKNDLIKITAESSGLNSGTVASVIDHFIRHLREQMGEGESVNLSPLGSFKVIQNEARNGRNPRSGEQIVIPARKSVKFKPSSSLRAKLQA